MAGRQTPYRNDRRPCALVTGGSSGIGRATCDHLAAAGFLVYEISRTGKDRNGIRHLTADVTNENDIQNAAAILLSEQETIDVLVLCAGSGISGATEMTDPSASHRQIDVNLFGADRVVRALLPVMREHGSGKIVFVSSVAGLIPIPFQSWYSASKAAILSYAGALRNEVRPFGIKVCAVCPGDIRTGFTKARKKSVAGDDLYGGRIERAVSKMEQDEQQGMMPEAVAECIVRQSQKKRPAPIIVVGGTYKMLSFLIKILPARFALWMVGKMY